jgi:hypothetical protein
MEESKERKVFFSHSFLISLESLYFFF